MRKHIQTIHEILDHLEAEFSIDTNREYVTGLSMGGGCTWLSIIERPNRFAAAVPICAGDRSIGMDAGERGKKFAQFPLWIFHGAEDNVISVDVSRRVVEELKKAGGNPRYTEYPEVKHNSWEKENPEKVKKGMEIITESVMIFVKECVRLGIDGFYASTQGGESHRFEDVALFNECIKPYDLTIMEEINRSCIFNILHICDYHDGYSDLTPFLNYPGHAVNCNPRLDSGEMTGEQISRMFNRPYMGGMDRKGIIASGSRDEIKNAVKGVLDDSPERYILGADCTLPGDIDWDNIRAAISTAHEYERTSP